MHSLQIKMTEQVRQQLAARQVASGREVLKVRYPNGVRKVTGGKHLKSTQSYPRAFGHRVARLHSQWKDARLLLVAKGKSYTTETLITLMFKPLKPQTLNLGR